METGQLRWKLFYDGGCNLCHASQLRFERWAKERGQVLEVDVLTSDEALAKGYGGAMALEADGRVYFGCEAWLRAMDVAPPSLRWVSHLARIPFGRSMACLVYAIVARLRYRLFGRRTCPLPPR